MTRHNHFHQHCHGKEKACMLTVYDSADQLAVQWGIIGLHNPQVAVWPLNAGVGMETERVPAVGHWCDRAKLIAVTSLSWQPTLTVHTGRERRCVYSSICVLLSAFCHTLSLLPLAITPLQICCLHSVTHPPYCLLRSHHYKSVIAFTKFLSVANH